MKRLQQVLLKTPLATARTRRYQAHLDDYIDDLKARWDLDRGLCGSTGIALPHETISDYWELCEPERAACTPEAAARIYETSGGRYGTSPLALVVWCWRCKLSRHCGDSELLRFFGNGLRFYADSIRRDGTLATYGLNGLTWAHGWDIEGLIYGLVWCGEALDPSVSEEALVKLRLSGKRFTELGCHGTHGNQLAVMSLGLWLYGELLQQPDVVACSDDSYSKLLPLVLDDSGQVIEQYGPCMHYSFTSFFYVWLNSFLRGDEEAEERIANSLQWFRYRHTENLYPLAGPSARMHYELPNQRTEDILCGCEQMAATQPMFGLWTNRMLESYLQRRPNPQQSRGYGAGAVGHGAAPFIWAILAASQEREVEPHHRLAWDAPFAQYYERISLFGRSPLKYCLVKKRYQTHYNFRDFLPFSGIQTWAWGSEPPIIHPTIHAPSTTIGDGLDTARQGVSHNWAQRGAGVMAADCNFIGGSSPEQPTRLIARYDRLWRIVVFTEASTLLIEWGNHGPRRTTWTLNRIEPAPYHFENGAVIFEGRHGRLYSTLGQPRAHEVYSPTVTQPDALENVPDKVSVLEYDCGEGFAAFALSDESFRFGEDFQEAAARLHALHFSDAGGSYRLTLSEGFHKMDDALSMDPYVLLQETTIERV